MRLLFDEVYDKVSCKGRTSPVVLKKRQKAKPG